MSQAGIQPAAPPVMVVARIRCGVNRAREKDMHISAYRQIIRRNQERSSEIRRLFGIRLARIAGHRLDEIKQTLAEPRVRNGEKGAVELDAFGAG